MRSTYAAARRYWSEVALIVHRRQLMPRCEGNDKIAIEPSGRAQVHDQTTIRRPREFRDRAFDFIGFPQVDRGYLLDPEQWRHGLDDGKRAGSSGVLGGIPK